MRIFVLCQSMSACSATKGVTDTTSPGGAADADTDADADWEPGEDDADADADATGTDSEPTTFSPNPGLCPNTLLTEIDTAFDSTCEAGFTKESGYQNVAINDGSCDGGTSTDGGTVIVTE